MRHSSPGRSASELLCACTRVGTRSLAFELIGIGSYTTRLGRVLRVNVVHFPHALEYSVGMFGTSTRKLSHLVIGAGLKHLVKVSSSTYTEQGDNNFEVMGVQTSSGVFLTCTIMHMFSSMTEASICQFLENSRWPMACLWNYSGGT